MEKTKVTYETGKGSLNTIELGKDDTYSIENGVVRVYLNSQNKRRTYPLTRVVCIEEDWEKLTPNVF